MYERAKLDAASVLYLKRPLNRYKFYGAFDDVCGDPLGFITTNHVHTHVRPNMHLAARDEVFPQKVRKCRVQLILFICKRNTHTDNNLLLSIEKYKPEGFEQQSLCAHHLYLIYSTYNCTFLVSFMNMLENKS